MSSITLIGTGNMARTIGTLAVAGGNTVEVMGRDRSKAENLAKTLGEGAATGAWGAVPAGDIVILALLYEGESATGTSPSASTNSPAEPGPSHRLESLRYPSCAHYSGGWGQRNAVAPRIAAAARHVIASAVVRSGVVSCTRPPRARCTSASRISTTPNATKPELSQ
jgi:hypothetical protein